MTDLPSSYSDVADEYTQKFFGELASKPLDRELLSRFAEHVTGKGPVCDMGCGPGQIARYLRNCGVTEIFGMDIAPGMIEQARKMNPDIPFRVGDMRAIDAQDGEWAGISAFYSIIHIPREDVVSVLREWRRVLKPGGWVLLTIHLGDHVLHLDQWGETTVSLDYFFFQTAEMETYLKEAGFVILESIERSPYPDVEYQGRRAYIFAGKRDKNMVEIGAAASRTKTFTDEDVRGFAVVSGDENPVHLDADYASKTQFGQRIVHGMLTAGLISATLANDLPGEGTVYMSQTLQFKAPVFIGETITATVTVTKFREDRRIATLATVCTNQDGKVVLEGEAVVLAPAP